MSLLHEDERTFFRGPLLICSVFLLAILSFGRLDTTSKSGNLVAPFQHRDPRSLPTQMKTLNTLLNRTVQWRDVKHSNRSTQIPTLFAGQYETLDAELKECFASTSLGMMGMSLVRYQYLSLVNFLEHGTWIPWDGSEHTGLPSPVIENQWRGDANSDAEHWNRFFKGTNQALNGNEACDCFRSSSCSSPETSKGWCTTENRYYRRSLGDGRMFSVTYVQSFGPKYSPRGHWFVESQRRYKDVTSEQLCEVGSCGPPWNWVASDPEVLISVFRRLKLDHLLWYGGQSGFDNRVFHNRSALPAVDDMIFAANMTGVHGIFYGAALRSSHESSESARDPYIDDMQAKLFAAGWNSLSALELVEKLRKAHGTKHPGSLVNDGSKSARYQPGNYFYWDDIHYYPWVYEELNKALVSIMCG